METEVYVYVDIAGTPHLAGRLWARVRKGRESATFEYDPGWLENVDRIELEPALTLGPGPFHTPSGKPLFGTIGDSAPDRWGRALMRRAERRRAANSVSFSHEYARGQRLRVTQLPGICRCAAPLWRQPETGYA